MKRVILALLGILMVADFCMAQAGDFRQEGMATQNMATGGMTAAHPSLPIGSSARVINTDTNEEIEVIITGRIVPALYRIIDLSPVAASALGIGTGGHVVVTTARPPLPQPVPPPILEPPVVVAVVEPEPEPEPVPVPAPVIVIAEPEPEPELVFVAVAPEPLPPPQPISITIHNYIVVPDNPPMEHRERPIRRYRRPVPNIEPQSLVAIHEEALPAPPQESPAPLNMDLPINGVVVIPGLPDPHSTNVYRLQVGAYSGSGSASLAMRMVESAGFIAVQERHGNLFRVFVDDIPSSNVQSAVQRLAALGFTQVWIRE